MEPTKTTFARMPNSTDHMEDSLDKSAKSVWTLRTKGTDGLLHDHFDANRMRRRRTFDILNLSPGTYDLFVGIRRDVFFFGDRSEDIQERKSLDEVPVGTVPEHKPSVDEASEDDPSVDGEDEIASHRSDRSLLKHVKAGIGAALTGGRKVISTVTMGKVGWLGIHLELVIVDGHGNETVSISEQLECGEKANFEMRFTLKDADSCVKLAIKSYSTLHTIYVFSSIFRVEEAQPPITVEPPKAVIPRETIVTEESFSAMGGLEYDQPTQMLRRALTGSRHPERSAFARALAFSCFSSFCGFTIGYMLEADAALPLALVALMAWVTRVVIHSVVISVQ